MVMPEEHSSVPACGHRNPPGARFCDTCGVKLPMQCPRCHAINRGEANFCSNCGIGLGDARRTGAAPLIVPSGPSPDRVSATESESAPTRPEPLLPAKQAANERMEGPGSFDRLPLTAESTKGLFADEPDDQARLEHMVRSIRRLQRRRHTQRAWVLGAVGVSVVIAFLGVGLFRTRIEAPSAKTPTFTDTNAQASIAIRAEERGSAAIAQSKPRSTGPPDTTVQRYQHEDSPAPAAPAKLPAAASAHPRAGGELKFVVPSETPSYYAHRA